MTEIVGTVVAEQFAVVEAEVGTVVGVVVGTAVGEGECVSAEEAFVVGGVRDREDTASAVKGVVSRVELTILVKWTSALELTSYPPYLSSPGVGC